MMLDTTTITERDGSLRLIIGMDESETAWIASDEWTDVREMQ